MGSPSSFIRFLTFCLSLAWIHRARALDIAFDSIQCDESLSAFASSDDVKMTCDGGDNNRCSFGQEVLIEGSLHYHRLSRYTNGTGYASANLRLLSVEYNLFEAFPIDFCGDWVQSYNKTQYGNSCPFSDDTYYFNIPYTLPWDDDDITTWFATGWSGVSSLQVRNGNSKSSSLLADCTLHWHTYVTPSEEEGWRTMPSAAQTGIVLASLLTAILCCCTYLTCCRRRQKHITDVDYYNEFSDYEVSSGKIPKKKGKEETVAE